MRTADITGKVELPEEVKMVMPGDNVTAVFELISPVPLESGMFKLNPSNKNRKIWKLHFYFFNLSLSSLTLNIVTYDIYFDII